MLIFFRYCTFSYTAFLLALVLLPITCQAVPVTVEVRGVQGDLHKNIMARLKIARQQENTELTARHIRRLHKEAPRQIREALSPFGFYSVHVE
ncbi:MAG: outer membrane protein assembly factor, partial [Candidatus Electrothrix sp. AR3]|nr:outer membrane protein assembly factor [Candidatus Electrothrix sp. AR3]